MATKTKDLFIYHPGTGTLISLADAVYLCDSEIIDSETLESMENGATVDVFDHKGYRLDNYNMTNLFFGSEK
jgi:hypothetical protein